MLTRTRICTVAVSVAVTALLVTGCDPEDDDNATPTTGSPTASASASQATPEERLKTALEKKLSRSNRKGVKRFSVSYKPKASTTIKIAANKQFTEGLTRTAARRDVVSAISAVQSAKTPGKNWLFTVTYAMTDADGHTSEDQVMRLGFTRDRLEAIDPEGVNPKQIETRTDGARVVAPAFRY